MPLEAILVRASEKPQLWALLQDYIHELSVYDEFEAIDGVYPYRFFDAYWQVGEQRWPYWAISNGERVGFGLIRREETGEMEVAEFYVRPRFRRSGIGVAFARLLLSKHHGTWLMSAYRANTSAVLFWHKVIDGWQFAEEKYVGDGGKDRLLQRVEVT